jgi:hypothetical protein
MQIIGREQGVLYIGYMHAIRKDKGSRVTKDKKASSTDHSLHTAAMIARPRAARLLLTRN